MDPIITNIVPVVAAATDLYSMVDVATVAGFALGVTQLVKDLGVQGQILKLVCIVAGSVAWTVMSLFPETWASITGLLIALSTTGIVSFTDERLEQLKSRQ